MYYFKSVTDGYISTIGTGSHIGNITEEEYNTTLAVIHNKPTAPDGYDYKLREDLTWELYELPIISPKDEEATEEDYKTALNALGVNTE